MTIEMTLGFVRHLLTIVGGIMVAKGTIASGVMDAIIGGVLTVAGVTWSAVQKVQQAQAEARALATPVPTAMPLTRAGGPVLGMLLLALLLVVPTMVAAAEPNKRGTIGQPYSNPDQVPLVVGSFYVGALAGSDFNFDDAWFAGGLVGYKAKLSSGLVLGLEADATRRFIDLECASELDNWTFSIRPTVGFLLMPNLHAYGTAGAAWKGSDLDFVYGAGLELGLVERSSVRFEVLQFAHDDGQTVGRVAYVYRF